MGLTLTIITIGGETVSKIIGEMHVGPIKTSPAQQRILAMFHKRGDVGITTREIIELCDVCAVNTWLHALKINGLIYRKVNEGKNANGAMVIRYFLVQDNTGWINGEQLRTIHVPNRFLLTAEDFA